MTLPLPPTDGEAIRENIKKIARLLGFADCRVAPALPARHGDLFRDWVKEEKYGDMGWFARDPERRIDPRKVVEGAKSVVVLATNYFQGAAPEVPVDGAVGKIARYAWGEDYHDLLEGRLKELNTYLEDMGGKSRYYVDTGPVLERDFASEAGIGWNGKSTVQIHREFGTWTFLATIITTLELPSDKPAADHCGKCTRCMVACPTNAITGPREMDPRLCVSYLTIESKGAIPVELRRAVGDRIYGCDDCLTACPWNRFAQVSRDAEFAARERVFGMRLRDFLSIDEEEFRALFKKSPIKRIKRPAFLRNVCVALGNVGDAEDLAALELAAKDDEPLISEHARWAVEEIRLRA